MSKQVTTIKKSKQIKEMHSHVSQEGFKSKIVIKLVMGINNSNIVHVTTYNKRLFPNCTWICTSFFFHLRLVICLFDKL